MLADVVGRVARAELVRYDEDKPSTRSYLRPEPDEFVIRAQHMLQDAIRDDDIRPVVGNFVSVSDCSNALGGRAFACRRIDLYSELFGNVEAHQEVSRTASKVDEANCVFQKGRELETVGPSAELADRVGPSRVR